MKQTVSNEMRDRVLELRRRHSLGEVARLTGLNLNTIKTLARRSGRFVDNQKLRDLMTLPPIRPSDSRALVVPELPPQIPQTGDKEVDAVLWLRDVIRTGDLGLIAKAMEAAQQITTPLEALEKRYRDHLMAQHPGNWVAAFSSFGFADLRGLASASVEKLARQDEARARFGDSLFDPTPAEQFCIDALAGLGPKGGTASYDDSAVDLRFQAHHDLLPQTLGDCLHERDYWSALYWLRHAVDSYGDPPAEAGARSDFVFRCMAHLRPRSKEEALAVFHHLAANDAMGWKESDAILMNLIGNF